MENEKRVDIGAIYLKEEIRKVGYTSDIISFNRRIQSSEIKLRQAGQYIYFGPLFKYLETYKFENEQQAEKAYIYIRDSLENQNENLIDLTIKEVRKHIM